MESRQRICFLTSALFRWDSSYLQALANMVHLTKRAETCFVIRSWNPFCRCTLFRKPRDLQNHSNHSEFNRKIRTCTMLLLQSQTLTTLSYFKSACISPNMKEIVLAYFRQAMGRLLSTPYFIFEKPKTLFKIQKIVGCQKKAYYPLLHQNWSSGHDNKLEKRGWR